MATKKILSLMSCPHMKVSLKVLIALARNTHSLCDNRQHLPDESEGDDVESVSEGSCYEPSTSEGALYMDRCAS